MLPDFMIRAGLAGLGVALAAGPLGCFIIWRRMAYFGDATAHAAILGVALAWAVELPIAAGVLAVSLAIGLALSTLSTRQTGADALLGVFAHGALALGLVAASLITDLRMDLSAFLFGDVLAVSWSELATVWGGAVLVLALILWRWSALLASTLGPDVAHAAGFHPGRERLVLTLALALVVAFAIKIVGALLIAAMLIMPATAVRPVSRTPEMMAVLACAAGAAATLAGLWASWQWDTPTGPSMVVAAAVLFVVIRTGHGMLAPRGG
ncbi:MAG: iron chelate uptake ABC transporter family permease subunit [Pseudomonadota bacterium]